MVGISWVLGDGSDWGWKCSSWKYLSILSNVKFVVIVVIFRSALWFWYALSRKVRGCRASEGANLREKRQKEIGGATATRHMRVTRCLRELAASALYLPWYGQTTAGSLCTLGSRGRVRKPQLDARDGVSCHDGRVILVLSSR